VDGTIQYLNTDLDLTSTDDLTTLAAAFEAAGLIVLDVSARDALWYATLEVDADYGEPESAIDAMLAVVNALDEPLREVWRKCTPPRVQHRLRLRG